MYWRLLIVAVALFVQSCTPPLQEPPTPKVEKVQPPKPAPMEVVILTNKDIPAYSKVAALLSRQLGKRGSIRYLGSSHLENLKAVEPYRHDDKKQFVSIGLSASVAAKSLAGRQVVFCQVFNYQDFGLVSPRHKGVSMIPSIARTFSVWHALAPKTTDVGVIVGPDFDEVLQVASAGAKAQGIKLHYAVVNSDKEYQYAYKKMAAKVQGFWLLPDNRVLSANALREIMTFSLRNSKQVVVFSDELLSLGGLFSVTSDYRDIVRKVMGRLTVAEGKDAIPGPDILYLDKAILRINPVMAKRLNLAIPKKYRKYAKTN